MPLAFSFNASANGPDPYPEYSEIIDELQNLANQHNNIMTMEVIGHTWQDRDIWSVKISDNVLVDEDEPEVLYIGAHHGNELPSALICSRIIEHLVSNYTLDGRATGLVNERELFFIPLLNPDGYHQSIHYSSQRKNMKDNGDGTFGVDLNRNYDYMWGVSGTSTSTSDYNYGGPYPASEPEVRTIKNFTGKHNFTIALSYHSYGELVLYPWGYDHVAPEGEELLSALADNIAAPMRYTPGQASDPDVGMYDASGDYCDWAYHEHGVNAFTVEMGTSHSPGKQQLAAVLGQNLEGALVAAELAGNPEDSLLPQWTVMLYMAGDNDLNEEVQKDMNELEDADRTDEVNTICLVDLQYQGDTKLYQIEKDQYGLSNTNIISTELDDNGSVIPENDELWMNEAENLANFVNWTVDNYPAQHYLLVIWDHGKGLIKGMCKDKAYYMKPLDLQRALANIPLSLIHI